MRCVCKNLTSSRFTAQTASILLRICYNLLVKVKAKQSKERVKLKLDPEHDSALDCNL